MHFQASAAFGYQYYRMTQLNFFPGKVFNVTVQEMHQDKTTQLEYFAFLQKAITILLEVK